MYRILQPLLEQCPRPCCRTLDSGNWNLDQVIDKSLRDIGIRNLEVGTWWRLAADACLGFSPKRQIEWVSVVESIENSLFTFLTDQLRPEGYPSIRLMEPNAVNIDIDGHDMICIIWQWVHICCLLQCRPSPEILMLRITNLRCILNHDHWLNTLLSSECPLSWLLTPAWLLPTADVTLVPNLPNFPHVERWPDGLDFIWSN